MIKVLHVFGRLDRGGAETLVMNLYRNIDRSKFQFDFVKHTEDKCDYGEEILQLGGRIYSISRYTGKNHFQYKNQWKKFFDKHLEYRIIHGHMRSTASIYLSIAKSYGLKTIAHSHSTASRGNFIERSFKNIIQFPIRYIADYLLACSDEAGEWFYGKAALEKSNYILLKNAIDIEKYFFNQAIRKEMRAKLNIQNKFVIGHVGSFTYPKNHKFLINVFAEVYKNNSDTVLLLLGDGVLIDKIISQVKQLGLSEQVYFVGNIRNVNDYLQAMDVFVFPSIFEGLGIALIEAQASGLKCLCSENVPSAAIVTDLVEVVPLAKGSKCWSEKAVENAGNYKRGNQYHKIKLAGYDIAENVEIMSSFYMELATR